MNDYDSIQWNESISFLGNWTSTPITYGEEFFFPWSAPSISDNTSLQINPVQSKNSESFYGKDIFVRTGYCPSFEEEEPYQCSEDALYLLQYSPYY